MKFSLVSLFVALGGLGAVAQSADAIYFGGDVVTFSEAVPEAEAVAVEKGQIVALGSRETLEAEHKGPKTRLVDLEGKTLAPGFIDAHSHFFNALAQVRQINVAPPPVGPGVDVATIVETLKQQAGKVKAGAVIIAYGYDERALPEPLTKAPLDEAFPKNPVIVVHFSRHGAVLNSAALKQFKITAKTPDPDGGVIGRLPDSQEPNGLVMDAAYLPVMNTVAMIPTDVLNDRLRQAQNLYAAAGYTTVSEGAASAEQMQFLRESAAKDRLFLDFIALPLVTELDKIFPVTPPAFFGKYWKRLKPGGGKILMDGTVLRQTAFFKTPYLNAVTPEPTPTPTTPQEEEEQGDEEEEIALIEAPSPNGKLIFPQPLLNAMMKKCYDSGVQVFARASGDAAIDALLSAHRFASEGKPEEERRTVIIHAQFARKDQLEQFARYRLTPSFSTNQTFFFADLLKQARGQEATEQISPIKSAFDLGLHPTNHTDFNVTPLDPFFLLWTAVTRPARSGETLGAQERLTPREAWQAMTLNAARQYGEEAEKGSLDPGKKADLVILSANPLKVAPDALREIQVVETIKEGKTVFPAPTPAAKKGGGGKKKRR